MASDKPYKEIVERSTHYFKEIGLKAFLLGLPLQGENAHINQTGIREKILKNNSKFRKSLYTHFVNNPIIYERNIDQQGPIKSETAHKYQHTHTTNVYTFNENKDTFNNIHTSSIDTFKCLNVIQRMVDNLTNPEICGFVLVVAEVVQNQNFKPVAGGIVELLDEHERAIRGLWCRRSLPPPLSNELIKLTSMLTLAHAFEWAYPGEKIRPSNKLVSILDHTCSTFPEEANNFLMENIRLSKHWESQNNTGSHTDSPSCVCKCHKMKEDPDACMFWGISESRFVKQWDTRNLDEFIPKDLPNEFNSYFRCFEQGQQSCTHTKNLFSISTELVKKRLFDETSSDEKSTHSHAKRKITIM